MGGTVSVIGRMWCRGWVDLGEDLSNAECKVSYELGIGSNDNARCAIDVAISIQRVISVMKL